MNKRLIALLMLAALTLSLLAGCGGPVYIGEEKAKQIAMEDTYFGIEDAQNMTVELTEEEDAAYYTVSFTIEGMDYVYKLDAATGEILEYPTYI